MPAVFTLNLRGISIVEGVRASLATAAIVVVAALLDRPALLGAGLAAWLTCLGDAGGPMRRRIPMLTGFVLLGALFTGGFGLLRAGPTALTIVVASSCIFCTSFARIWGQPAMQAGNLLSIAIVLALRTPLPDFQAAIRPTLMFLAGGGWAILVAVVLWPIYPNLPARRAVADCMAALADLVGDLAGLAADPAAATTVWDAHLRGRRRATRDLLEAARTAVYDAARARGPIAGRTRENFIRLEAADQIFGALIGLSDILEYGADRETRAAAVRILRYLRPQLRLLGDYVVTEAPSRLDRMDRIAATMEALAPSGSPLHAAVVRITDRVRIAVTLAADDGRFGALAVDPRPPLRERVLAPVRANLSLRSTLMLHALRVTVASVAAFAVTLTWPGPYEHWLTITLLLTMQPFFGVTFTRALERVGGTVLGGILAAGLLYFLGTEVSLALAMVPLTMVAFALRPVSFGLFIMCITPIVVLLSEVSTTPGSQIFLAEMRALYTVIGGALALAVNYLLWPSWEPGRMLRELAAAIRAHGKYAVTEIDIVLGERPEADIEPCRRAAGLATNNLETSLQRMMLEPHSDRQSIEAAMTVDAALRRMAGRLSALQLDPGEKHDAAAWHAWRSWIADAAETLAGRRTDLPPRPVLPAGDRQGDALTRIARQFELSAAAISRLKPAP